VPVRLGARLETAIAMEETIIKQIPCSNFFGAFRPRRAVLRVSCSICSADADQQQVIANLVTVDSEQRLGKTLFATARKLARKIPRSIRIEPKITP